MFRGFKSQWITRLERTLRHHQISPSSHPTASLQPFLDWQSVEGFDKQLADHDTKFVLCKSFAQQYVIECTALFSIEAWQQRHDESTVLTKSSSPTFLFFCVVQGISLTWLLQVHYFDNPRQSWPSRCLTCVLVQGTCVKVYLPKKYKYNLKSSLITTTATSNMFYLFFLVGQDFFLNMTL